MNQLEYRIQLWEKHLTQNPKEIISVVAVLAATNQLLTIEEEDETTEETSSTHADQGDTPEGNQTTERDAT